MSTPDPAEFTRQQIFRRCEAALKAAGVINVFPTPLEQVLSAARLDDIVDIADLPDAVYAKKPNAMRRILGATVFKTRTVFVDMSQPATRARWTLAHEGTHALLPWHEHAALLDDDRTLFQESAAALETEANIGAGYLMFQGGRWMSSALEYQHSLDAPIGLADMAGASMHASIRYYVESHPDPTALLVTGRRIRRDGTVPTYLSVESQSWKSKFPPAANIFGTGLNVGAGPLLDLVFDARRSQGICRESVGLDQITGSPTGSGANVVVEVFDNQYNHFVLLRPARRLRLGRRIVAQVGAAS